ncbi:MarR family transcriptional regulator [Chloroflexia bacterium SDU3-3]|nr:MarR family transcriptional regulator [Chloroflexia bacterium SDU3-3]
MNSPVARTSQIGMIDQMMYAIVWHSQKQITHTLTQPEIDLTLPQLMTLFAVQNSGPCRMSLLADLTRQSAGTLTGIVDRLIADGLLERARNVNDRRVIEVALTAEGERRLNGAVGARREEMQKALNMFTDTDLSEFAQFLQRFLDRLHHNTPITND